MPKTKTTGNPYLARLRERYTALQESITGLQERAAEEERDLTDDELRSVTEQGEQAATLYTQIEQLTEIEQRNRQVGELAASLAGGDGDGTQTRARGGAQTQDRDPGHYRSVEDGGRHSFFADMFRKEKLGDADAAQRLEEHTRALTTTQGAGVIPPVWLGDLFDEALSEGRAVANAVRRIPITAPATMTLPRQTTRAGVAEQTAENAPVHEESPGFASAVTTVTPKATAGKQTISRQLLDASNPTVDQLIYTDLLEDYNDRVEAKVAGAIMAAGPTALAADAAEDDLTDPTHYNKVALRAQVAVRRNRKRRRANLYVVSTLRWGEVLGLTDTAGRPLVPMTGVGQAVNVAGVGSVSADGIWHGLPMVATAAIDPDEPDAPLEDAFAAVYSPDVLLFESALQRFTFEEPKGPESIILAAWAYTAVHVRYGGNGVQVVEVEAGSPESPS